ncbi:MAG: [FeFe] hydrogenase, group A [Eubacteriales bacterium]|nr:[FeFe] hydrogenase, group A [Eubacteriales bacterium]
MSMTYVTIDKNICTGCQECTKVCPVDAIEGNPREAQEINTDKCVMCGQCVQKCKSYVSIVSHGNDAYEKVRKERNLPETVKEPLFAAYNVTHINEVIEALEDKSKFTMVQSAPAVRMAIAEEFGFPLGSLADKKMAAALRKVGFDKVYDTDFSADLTIMEEGTELITRVTKGGVLPMFTSCCPAWVRFMELNYPEMTDHLSSCKSPQQMLGPIFKTYGAQESKIKPENVFSVSVMPCTCKEYECNREEMKSSGFKDVDVVLTTRELAYLIKYKGIDFANLKDEEYDSPLGDYTGAGVIFGVGGGVMEAALRTGYELITKKAIPDVNILSVRNYSGIKTSLIQVGDLTLKVGVVTGLKNVKEVMEDLKAGKLNDYHFIEVMTCPSGCVSGGGQPKLLEDTDTFEAIDHRRNSTYKHDENLPLRKSHDNPSIKKIYKDYFGEPNGEKSHHLLHTTYYNGKTKKK